MSGANDTRAALARGSRRALVVGAVALATSLVGAAFDLDRFLESWLFGWLFWLGLSLGSLGLISLHHATGGSWGFAIRQQLLAAAGNLPLVALLFLPVLFGLGRLYPWAVPGAAEGDPLLAHKAPYLNVPFFVARAFIYFAAWIGLAVATRRRLAAYEREPGKLTDRRLRRLAGPALGIYGLTMTFAAFDWGMSLEPHWFSTIYGVIFIIGQALSTIAFAIVTSAWLARREPGERLERGHFHDLGNLAFAFVMLWAYVSFSQYLIIWSGNLAEETPWYLRRLGLGWQAIAVLLLGFHFFVPFFVLLSRRVKRASRVLATVAGGLLVMRFLDLYWLVQPAFDRGGLALHWLDLTVPVGLGGLWTGLFLRRWAAGPLLSDDPGLSREGASAAEVGVQEVTS